MLLRLWFERGKRALVQIEWPLLKIYLIEVGIALVMLLSIVIAWMADWL
jgi:hypothetical protein